MNIKIQDANPAADYERIAELITLGSSESVTAATIHDWDHQAPEARIRYRLVAVDTHGKIMAYAIVQHFAWDPAERFGVWLVVDPAHRNQGIGAALYDHVLALVRQHDAAILDSEVRDDCPEGQRFAEKRGFRVRRHMFVSRIDLATFDESRFTGVVETVESSGIRLFSLADAGDTEEARRKLHHVNYVCALDDPASSGTFPDFDALNSIFNTSAWFLPEGEFLAADGDHYVGLSGVGYFSESNSMHNMMTGVLPAYRGRGIAKALKLLTIRFARTYGTEAILTDNDSQNAPMLAINRQLGYKPLPGKYFLINTLEVKEP